MTLMIFYDLLQSVFDKWFVNLFLWWIFYNFFFQVIFSNPCVDDSSEPIWKAVTCYNFYNMQNRNVCSDI